MADFLLKDVLEKVTRALTAAAGNVTSDALDLGHGTNGNPLFNGELLLTAPALTTAMAPDTKTFSYDIIESANADLLAPTTVVAGAIVQTGAGGAGAASATYRFKPASDAKRYFGVKITSVATTGDASSVSATLEIVF